MSKELKKIILIGGAPGTGKSTIARQLSKQLGLPWISTDQIRGMVKKYTTSKQHPNLLLPKELETAEKFLSHFSAEQIVERVYKQAESVWPAVSYLIEENYAWEDGVIIEGVNVVPELITENCPRIDQIKSVFLIDENHDRLREVVYGRGIWDDADSYSDDLKPKEIEWVTLFTQKLKKSATKLGFPVVEVNKNEDDIKKVSTLLGI